LWLSHNCGGKLILHNTLDSLEAILWSKVGPGFSISGKNLVFIASNDTYGKAVGTIGKPYLFMLLTRIFEVQNKPTIRRYSPANTTREVLWAE